MKLDLFLIDFFQTGEVTVERELKELDNGSAGRSLELLAEYHRIDSANMPYDAPTFHPNAALWAAKYIYSTLQFILLRDLDVSHIEQVLVDYPGSDTAEEIYSADLMLRLLPAVFKLASGLSPEDPLVSKVKDIAQKWPFSTVGVEGIIAGVPGGIFENLSLRQAYIDRIISRKDIGRTKSVRVKKMLDEVLGIHADKLWPNLNLALNEENI